MAWFMPSITSRAYQWYSAGDFTYDLMFQVIPQGQGRKKADLKMFAVAELWHYQSERPSAGHTDSLHTTSVITTLVI